MATNLPNATRELLREQARAYICGEVGHSLGFVLPLQIRHETREVLCKCRTCEETTWFLLPEDGFKRFLQDAEAGKIT